MAVLQCVPWIEYQTIMQSLRRYCAVMWSMSHTLFVNSITQCFLHHISMPVCTCGHCLRTETSLSRLDLETRVNMTSISLAAQHPGGVLSARRQMSPLTSPEQRKLYGAQKTSELYLL